MALVDTCSEVLRSVLRTVLDYPMTFVAECAEYFYDQNVDVLLCSLVCYTLLIVYGPTYMKDRKAYNLRGVSAVWNLLLSAYSFLGARSLLVTAVYMVRQKGFYSTTCFFDKHYIFSGDQAFWLFSFTISKIPEMFDTVLLVLQKKPVIFLHWYHHLTVAIFCWYSGRVLNPSGLWFALINYGVHAVMYLYYFFCSMGLRRVVRPFAPFITAAQLLQMVVGIAIVFYTFYYSYLSPHGCGVDRTVIRMGILMYGSYVVLFAALFSRLYLRSRKNSKCGEPNGQVKNGHGVANGVMDGSPHSRSSQAASTFASSSSS